MDDELFPAAGPGLVEFASPDGWTGMSERLADSRSVIRCARQEWQGWGLRQKAYGVECKVNTLNDNYCNPLLLKVTLFDDIPQVFRHAPC